MCGTTVLHIFGTSAELLIIYVHYKLDSITAYKIRTYMKFLHLSFAFRQEYFRKYQPISLKFEELRLQEVFQFHII